MTDDRSVLGRALLVVNACVMSEEAISLAELTTTTGLPKPTARRIAEQLVGHGLLRRTPTGYLCGPTLWAFAARAEEQHRQGSALMPYLADLNRGIGADVWVVDISGDDWSVLATVHGQRIATRVDTNAWPRDVHHPAILATALGRIGLASRPEQAVRLLRTGPVRLTPFTDVAPSRILAAVLSAAANQETIEHDGVVSGMSCLAVTVPHQPGRPRAALMVVDRTSRFRTTPYLKAAHATATELAKHIEHRHVDVNATELDRIT